MKAGQRQGERERERELDIAGVVGELAQQLVWCAAAAVEEVETCSFVLAPCHLRQMGKLNLEKKR